MGPSKVNKATNKPFNPLATKKMIADIKKRVADVREELKFKPKPGSEIAGNLSFKTDSSAQYVAGKVSVQEAQIAEKNPPDSSTLNAAKKVLPNVSQVVVDKNPHK